ncbi:MAG TPA: hypothetical protein VJZ69_01925 [Clostridia bacterium]|nr:hypothetical protein [Clostridia bacterium]
MDESEHKSEHKKTKAHPKLYDFDTNRHRNSLENGRIVRIWLKVYTVHLHQKVLADENLVVTIRRITKSCRIAKSCRITTVVQGYMCN